MTVTVTDGSAGERGIGASVAFRSTRPAHPDPAFVAHTPSHSARAREQACLARESET